MTSSQTSSSQKYRYEQVAPTTSSTSATVGNDVTISPEDDEETIPQDPSHDTSLSPPSTKPSSSSHKIIFCALTSSLSGLLFGFDTVVISGAEQQIQSQWNLSDGMHGLVIAMAIWGTVVGSIVGAWPPEILGRTKTLFFIGVLYVISAIWSAAAGDEYQFMIARALGGLGVGISTVTSPLYNSEISPPQWRGRLAGLFQFQIVVGILVAYISNAIIMEWIGESHPEQAWRWMMGVAAVPALLYTLLSCALPESPRWLVTHQHDPDAALAVLQTMQPDNSVEELQSMVQAMEREAHNDSEARSHERFWSRRLARPIFLAIAIGTFNQLSGINAILYFAPRVFEMTGLGAENALMQSIGIGLTNLVFTFVGLYLIDKLGRRTLLLIGTIGYIVTLLTCAFGFWAEIYAIVPWAIFGFIGAHAVGQGTVIWVFVSEIFPTKFRSKGQGLGSFSHWINAALISTFFPKVVDATSPQFAFFLFAAFMMIALVWVICCVPETKGVPLEEIGKVLGFDVVENDDNAPILNKDSDDPTALTSKYTDAFTIDDEEDDDVFIDEHIEMGKIHPRGTASSTTLQTDGARSNGSDDSPSLVVHHAHNA